MKSACYLSQQKTFTAKQVSWYDQPTISQSTLSAERAPFTVKKRKKIFFIIASYTEAYTGITSFRLPVIDVVWKDQ